MIGPDLPPALDPVELDLQAETAEDERRRDEEQRSPMRNIERSPDEKVIRFVIKCAAEECPTCNPSSEGAECAHTALEALDRILGRQRGAVALLEEVRKRSGRPFGGHAPYDLAVRIERFLDEGIYEPHPDSGGR